MGRCGRWWSPCAKGLEVRADVGDEGGSTATLTAPLHTSRSVSNGRDERNDGEESDERVKPTCRVHRAARLVVNVSGQ